MKTRLQRAKRAQSAIPGPFADSTVSASALVFDDLERCEVRFLKAQERFEVAKTEMEARKREMVAAQKRAIREASKVHRLIARGEL